MKHAFQRFAVRAGIVALSFLPLFLGSRMIAASETSSTTKQSGDDGDYKPLNELGATVKGVRFSLVRRGRHRVDIVVRGKGFTLAMPDQVIMRGAKDDRDTYYPGETGKGYGFFLSPDHNWLFVERGLMHRYAVGYLYRRVSPTRMVAVRPGDAFYDAALRQYCAKHHVDFAKLISKERNIGFHRWDLAHHRVYFWEWTQSNWEDRLHKGDICAGVDMAFDLQTQKFTVVKEWKPY